MSIKIKKTIQKKLHKDYTLYLPTLSAVILGTAFLNTHFYIFGFIGLLPFIWFIFHLTKFSKQQIIRSIYWSGLVYGSIIFAWELQTSPSSWTALEGSLSIVTKILAWTLSAFIFSIGFWLLARYILRFRHQPRTILVTLPFVWALMELTRTYLFAIITYGPGSSISPNWNLGVLGLTLMPTPLAYISRFVGLLGSTIVVVLINIAMYFIIVKRRYMVAAYICTPLLLLSVIGYILFQPNTSNIFVSSIHLESTDTLEAWDSIPLPEKNTDILVAPEYSLIFNNKNYETFLKNSLGPQTTLITSVATDGKPGQNELTLYETGGGFVNKQPKTFLIAGGEYMPYIFSGFFKAIKQEYLTKAFNDSQQIKKGSTPEQAVQLHKVKTGSLVCSGVLALSEYRRLTNEGAEVLTNSASLSLIANASLYHVQEGYLTRFHSIANARPFIHSSRSGESYILDANGTEKAHATGNSQLLNAQVKASNRKTPYTILGEWTVLLGIIFTLVYIRRF
jgi:apolipoprotein N-acyltransferase